MLRLNLESRDWEIQRLLKEAEAHETLAAMQAKAILNLKEKLAVHVRDRDAFEQGLACEQHRIMNEGIDCALLSHDAHPRLRPYPAILAQRAFTLIIS